MENVTVRTVRILANNQVVIYLTNGTKVFNSYGKNIVQIDKEGQVLLDEYYYAYSNTTSKYRCQFLGELKTETDKKLKNGEYIYANLN